MKFKGALPIFSFMFCQYV